MTGVMNVDTVNPTSNLHSWEPQDTTKYFITRHCNVSQRKTMTTACQLFQLFSEEQECSEWEVGPYNTSPVLLSPTDEKSEHAVSLQINRVPLPDVTVYLQAHVSSSNNKLLLNFLHSIKKIKQQQKEQNQPISTNFSLLIQKTHWC